MIRRAFIRASLEFFGADTSDLTDEELADNAIRVSRVVAQVGITTEEAARSLTVFARLMAAPEEPAP